MREPVRVLIADDHQVVREGLQMILAESDGEIVVVGEASDGDEAVRLATKVQPDVVLMDLSMPRMDGLEATRRLREAGVNARVLILTSFAEREGVRDAVRAGVTGYLMKDVLKSELLAAIRRAADGVPTLHPRAQQHLMRGLAEPDTPSPFSVLTPRERDVLTLLARGESNKRIAAALNLSIGTVKGYVSAIFEKLGVDDRTQAALLAAKFDSASRTKAPGTRQH
ncbi:MAG TPA: response regulator transcription factor [Gemmatimonadaceae bacterium]|jgi:DNA-binding NarL/FixJ family response regulator|nr:response regulator transcription factor [Gemmatimonadaceae bacterium]